MRNGVHLITYADRLGGDLPGLGALLEGDLADDFVGVHILPFFVPYDGADAGFDTDDHTAVDPRLGSWDDVAAIASRMDVMIDLIVNHVSRRSAPFLDWKQRGASSPYEGMFLTLDAVFPDGATEADLVGIYRPRPGLPFAVARIAGRKRLLWSAFTDQQIDLDVDHPAARRYLIEVMDTIAAAGASIVRLDAVGYSVKTAGTSCFMTPETEAFIAELTEMCHQRGLESLVEIHSHHERQVQIASKVDFVYDFALPPLTLHALLSRDLGPLTAWLEIRPVNCVSVLDTHDGIGVIDVGTDAISGRPGLLTDDQVDALVDAIRRNTGGVSELATGPGASNVDLYQVNSTFYDALGADDAAYLLARAIQLFLPGIPQIYYVGFLAGRNDVALFDTTGVGRDVNRHHYDRGEVTEELGRPVVKGLRRLIRLRNTHPAFAGEFTWDRSDSVLRLSWVSAGASAVAQLDVDTREGRFELTDGTTAVEFDLTDLLLPPDSGVANGNIFPRATPKP